MRSEKYSAASQDHHCQWPTGSATWGGGGVFWTGALPPSLRVGPDSQHLVKTQVELHMLSCSVAHASCVG